MYKYDPVINKPITSEPYKYLGNFSVEDPIYSRYMSCDECNVSWTGCWNNFMCPICGKGKLPHSNNVDIQALNTIGKT